MKARSIGLAQLSSENFPIAKYASNITITPDTIPTIKLVRNTINTPIASYFGGARSSSAEILSRFSTRVSIRKNKENGSDRDEYICDIQNGKIFHRDKVYDMSDKDALIGM